jgi:hypothetical protein
MGESGISQSIRVKPNCVSLFHVPPNAEKELSMSRSCVRSWSRFHNVAFILSGAIMAIMSAVIPAHGFPEEEQDCMWAIISPGAAANICNNLAVAAEIQAPAAGLMFALTITDGQHESGVSGTTGTPGPQCKNWSGTVPRPTNSQGATVNWNIGGGGAELKTNGDRVASQNFNFVAC